VKRFWTETDIEPAGEGGRRGFAILLDGRPMHLPGGAILRVGPEALARAIAAEWQAAGADGREVSFDDTPLTRIAGTAQERIAPDSWPTIDAIARYAESDLLCYRADQPSKLVARQAEEWQPWLDWAAQEYGAVLRVTAGITPIRQHRDSVAVLRDAVAAYDPYGLAALGVAVPALGSLVLGLALAEARLDPVRAYALSALDELFQAELWGEDEEAAARRRAVAADVALAARFRLLTRGAA
jgi:chaperone required for assembly of F1-ATPase